MPISPTDIASAYARAARQGAGGGLEPRGTAGEGGFAELVKSAVGPVREATAQAEAMSIKGVAGQADLTEVVTAVANAEVTLQTIVAVRNRVIQAYQEILRMPI